jgi:hypothetical protein
VLWERDLYGEGDFLYDYNLIVLGRCFSENFSEDSASRALMSDYL